MLSAFCALRSLYVENEDFILRENEDDFYVEALGENSFLIHKNNPPLK